MRSIAVMNQKGGVGKTTTAVNLAAALIRQKQRVLLIDVDPQAHATLHCGVEVGADGRSLYDVFVRGAALAEVAHDVDRSLTVVPAHIDLVAVERDLADDAERDTVLRRVLEPYHEHFDFLIIDCAPSLGVLTINALAACDEVFIPLQPHFLALQGLGKLLETVGLVRGGLQPQLRVSGIVFCMSESGTRLAQEVYGDVDRFIAEADPSAAWAGATVFRTRIRRNIKLAEAPSFGKTIFQYAPASHGAEDYAALAAEVLQMPASQRVLRQASAATESVMTSDVESRAADPLDAAAV